MKDEEKKLQEPMSYTEEEQKGAFQPYGEEELAAAGAADQNSFEQGGAETGNCFEQGGAEDRNSMEQDETGEGASPEQSGPDAPDQETAGNRTGGRKKRRFGWIIPAALIAIFVFSFGNFMKEFLTYRQAKEEYKKLDSYIEVLPETGEADSGEEGTEEAEEAEDAGDEPQVDYPKLLIDYDALQKTNPEFVGVIYLPVLDLKYPIAQAENNDKYLHTTFEGTNNASGCIFLDTVAKPDFSDRNTFVFGHNMKNQTMFGSLKRFLQDEALCDQDPFIYIYQKDQVLVYRIFAYYTIPVRDDVYDDFTGDDGYDAYVKDAKNHSVYHPEEDGIDWERRPDLLTLSTCYSTGHVNNFIVQGALVGTAKQY